MRRACPEGGADDGRVMLEGEGVKVGDGGSGKCGGGEAEKVMGESQRGEMKA